MSILNRLPGLQAEARWKQILAALYYLLIVLVLVGGLTGGATGLALGILGALWLFLPVVLIASRAKLPLVGGESVGQKALGWSLAILAWAGLAGVLASVTKGGPFDVAGGGTGPVPIAEQPSAGTRPEATVGGGGASSAGALGRSAAVMPTTAVVLATATPPEPTATPTPELASREAPIPLDKSYALNGKDGKWQFNLGIARVLLGAEANAFLKDVNMFNSDPTPGNQYVLFYAVAKVEGDDVPRDFTNYDSDDWTVVAGGRPFNPPLFSMIVMPDPEFEGELLPPGELGGWVLVEVPETEELVAVFRRGKQPYGDWWFALK